MKINYDKPRVSTLLKKLLPTQITWLSKEEVCAKQKELSGSYKEILVATEKHGDDIQITFGWISPIHSYSDFEIYRRRQGLGSNPSVLVDINTIIAIGLIEQYIC